MTELLPALLEWTAAHPALMGLLIFAVALGESLAMVGMLMPGAVLMFGFGTLIALGHIDFYAAWAWAALGAIIGDGLSFWLGRYYHQQLRELWPFSRHPLMLSRSEAFFRRHGGKSVLMGRFFGPVRAVIPAVAGMLDMPTGRFFVVNVLSALLWAPVYLLPGIVFGASLELAAQVAWRLVTMVVVVLVVLWLTVYLVTGLYRLLHPRMRIWLLRYSRFSRNKPVLGLITSAILDPKGPELRGLALSALVLLGTIVFVTLALAALGQELPTLLDRSLYRYLQDLRTPLGDDLMVLVTEVGALEVKIAMTGAVFVWLAWQRAWTAALHWLLALGFAALTVELCKELFRVERPLALYHGVDAGWAFPSNHAAMGTVIFGFLAVMAARETRPAQRWIPYLAAALAFIPIAFSRLYLGVHWLSDTLAGVALGLFWASLLGLAYNRRPAPPLPRQGLLTVSLTALVLSMSVHASLNHAADLERYRIRQAPDITISRDYWWESGWRELPHWRRDLQGQHHQPLELQWATHRPQLLETLTRAGWQPAPEMDLKRMLMWLNPRAELEDLPVLPRVHDGRYDEIRLFRPGPGPDQRQVLHFWSSGVMLEDGRPVWLGSLTVQQQVRRLGLLSLALDTASAPAPELPDSINIRHDTITSDSNETPPVTVRRVEKK